MLNYFKNISNDNLPLATIALIALIISMVDLVHVCLAKFLYNSYNYF